MKISELKVDDKVIFKTRSGEYIKGQILQKVGDSFHIKPIFYDNPPEWRSKDDIIAKLEPLPLQYKEIKIEHEKRKPCGCLETEICFCVLKDKSSIKISNLKTGDKIKYTKKHSNEIKTGEIYSIRWGCFFVDFGKGHDEVYFENVVCKLEPIYCYHHVYGSEEYEYKEIPIEKEENPYWISVVKTVSYPYSVPETSYHCPKCDKKLWGTCGMPIKQYANEPCQECKNKEKSAPKPSELDQDIDYLIKNPEKTMGAKYHDAGACWQLIDRLVEKLRKK